MTTEMNGINGSLISKGNLMNYSVVPVTRTPPVSMATARMGSVTTMATPRPPLSTPTTSQQAQLNRRSSSRSIKRRKFDDELVESSLVKSAARGRLMSGSFQYYPETPVESVHHPTPPAVEHGSGKKKTSSSTSKAAATATSASKRAKKTKNVQSLVTKDIGRWKPTDDMALIIAVQQTNDLHTVFQGVKFSCKFNLQEIQDRWHALLYIPGISKIAVTAMKQLHPEIISAVQSRALFSKAEEKLLALIPSNIQPALDIFQTCLNDNVDKFYQTRTAKSLYNHWLLMRQHHLLSDQKVQPAPQEDNVLNFSDAEDMLNDNDLKDTKDDVLERELSNASRRVKSEIRRLENELPKWQVLVDTVTGISPPEFDNHTLAVLRGRLVRYLMRSREITLGRATKESTVDIDLSLEGPAWKISRLQGVIRLRTSGEFFLSNEGKRPIYIDGKPVLKGNKYKLSNNAVVEIAGLRFIFLINYDLVNCVRAEASKIFTS